MTFMPRSEEPRRIPRPGQTEFVFLAAAVSLWGFLRFCFGWVTDDAFITFAYARNLVDGAGFVFNPGEHVYGTTAPYFGFFVAIGMKLGVEPWTWAMFWDVVWGALLFWRIREIMFATGAGRWWWLAVALIVCAPQDMLPVAGMETGFYGFLIFSALSAICRQAPPWETVLFASLSAIFRPDGLTVLVSVAPFVANQLYKSRSMPGTDFRRQCLLAASPLVLLPLHGALMMLLFGDVVPQSMRAKALNAAQAPLQSSFLWGFAEYVLNRFGKPNLLAMVGVTGLLLAGRRRNHLPVTTFFVIHTGFFVAGRAPAFQWYATILCWLIACGAARLLGRAAEWAEGGPSNRISARQAACAIVLAAGLFSPQAPIHAIISWRGSKEIGPKLNQKNYQDAAEFIRSRTRSEDRVVAAHEVGLLAYFLQGHVEDLEGLVSKEIYELRRAGRTDELLALSKSNWFVQPFVKSEGDPRDSPPYQQAVAAGFFEVHRYDQPPDEPFVTVVFERKDR